LDPTTTRYDRPFASLAHKRADRGFGFRLPKRGVHHISLGGGDAPDPPPPDPAQQELARVLAQLAPQQMAYGQRIGNEGMELARRIIDQQLATGNQSMQLADQHAQRYYNTFAPLEDQYVRAVQGYDYMTPEEQHIYDSSSRQAAMRDLDDWYQQQLGTLRERGGARVHLGADASPEQLSGGENNLSSGGRPDWAGPGWDRLQGARSGNENGAGAAETPRAATRREQDPEWFEGEKRRLEQEYQRRRQNVRRDSRRQGTMADLARTARDREIAEGQAALESSAQRHARLGKNQGQRIRRLGRAEGERMAADIGAQADAASAQQRRELMRMGVNPNSGRFGALGNSQALTRAGMQAGARNEAVRRYRGAAEDVRFGGKREAMALRDQATNYRFGMRDRDFGRLQGAVQFGRGMPSGAYQGYGLGLNAGSAASSAQAQGTQGAIAGGNYGYGAYNAANNAYDSLYDQRNAAYQGQLNAWTAGQQAQSDLLGSIAGAVGLAASGGAFSSKKLKHKKKKVVEGEVVEKVKRLPVERWTYKPGIEDSGRHIGPYAEDFKKRFGVGDGVTLHPVDAAGVALAAVKGLAKKIDKIEKKVARRAA
jgi:hypothetical protein